MISPIFAVRHGIDGCKAPILHGFLIASASLLRHDQLQARAYRGRQLLLHRNVGGSRGRHPGAPHRSAAVRFPSSAAGTAIRMRCDRGTARSYPCGVDAAGCRLFDQVATDQGPVQQEPGRLRLPLAVVDWQAGAGHLAAAVLGTLHPGRARSRRASAVLLGPVRHGLVERPTDWPHSSIHRDIRIGRIEAE